MESEGRCKQISGLTNRNHIRLQLRIRLLYKLKSNNYSELTVVRVAHISKVKYLGYAFYRHNGKCRFRVHPKSVVKMRDKIRELTDRNNGMSNTKREKKYSQYVIGWINYFKLVDMKGLLKETDEWTRRRIRAVYWKQWKKIKTKYRMLKALGLEHWQAMKLANSRKGIWRMAQVLSCVFSNKIIAKLGYTSMLDYYLKVCEN